METKIARQVPLACCPHILEYLGASVGDIRKLNIQIGDDSWQIERACLALSKEPCDCEDAPPGDFVREPTKEQQVGARLLNLLDAEEARVREERDKAEEFMQRYQKPGGEEITITGEYDT